MKFKTIDEIVEDGICLKCGNEAGFHKRDDEGYTISCSNPDCFWAIGWYIRIPNILLLSDDDSILSEELIGD